MTGGPAVFSIAAHRRFLDVLAHGLLEDTGADPLSLSKTTVLLPTRRACRALQHALLKASAGVPILLPRLVPLGDLDDLEADLLALGAGDALLDLPAPIPPLRRQMMLAELVRRMPVTGADRPTHMGLDHALKLADALAHLQDEVDTERLSFERLPQLAPEDYAHHWQITLDVLALITEVWPKILSEQMAMNPMAHRNAVFAAIAKAWTSTPPEGAIIAAGSTGSIPATADLLNVIATLPKGSVILPGLDQNLEPEAWDQLDESHPQFGLSLLLNRFGLPRAQVSEWKPDIKAVGADPNRAALISHAMRPAATTAAWREQTFPLGTALNGVSRIECDTEQEEADAIALILREALDQPEQTACLITPDRPLARRVSAALDRWGLAVDDSAGQPLSRSPAAVFLCLLIQAIQSDYAPSDLLALLKHPYTAVGRDRGVLIRSVRLLEQRVLRGPRPAPGLQALRQLVAEETPLAGLIEEIAACLAPLETLFEDREANLSAMVQAHAQAAESLATAVDEPGPARLWRGNDGIQLAGLLADISDAATNSHPIDPGTYLSVFNNLISAATVRAPYGTHPRLSILGPMEARLLQPDVVVLGGLNEGIWPPDPAADPWMSRPMREAFGLPGTARRIGLSAHDFAQAFCAKRVVLSRAKRVDQTPTVPSRWLRRLQACITAATSGNRTFAALPTYQQWARQLDEPSQVTPAAPPAPRPPVSARPRQLSVTRVETWMRDPYAIYADRILNLRALDPIDADPSAADYGTLVHSAFEAFVEDGVPEDPEAATQRLTLIGHELLAAEGRPALLSFWLPRWERIAAWAITHWDSHGQQASRSFVELRGTLEIAAPAGAFTLSATADRIDVLQNGHVRLLDYKTGAPPSQKEIEAGYAPQLPLEAAIVTDGGFPNVPKAPVSEACFWHVHGRAEGGDIRPVKGDLSALADQAREGLADLVARFDDPETPYPSRPVAQYAPKYSDYVHLARVAEWASEGGEGG